jgi:CheY-like chemotaxis protein
MKTLDVLLIEDDAIEVMKFKKAMMTLERNHELIQANNGEEALTLLKERKLHPSIIFLDLNMPRINGIEFLQIIKKDPNLMYFPVIVLTTSSNKNDIKTCYENYAAGYIIKPLKYEDYITKIRYALKYWSLNELIRTL